MMNIKNPRFHFDKELIESKTDKKYILGIDEVGWGCIAGELVLGGALVDKDIFNQNSEELLFLFENIKDSKKVSDKKRIKLMQVLKSLSDKYIRTCVGVASVDFINSHENLATAYTLCIDQILNNFSDKLLDSHILIDGNRNPKTNKIKDYELLIKGDDKSFTIGIASNVAKEFRDQLMINHSEKFKLFDFENNVGYGTPKHIEALLKYGLTPIHRIKATSSIIKSASIKDSK